MIQSFPMLTYFAVKSLKIGNRALSAEQQDVEMFKIFFFPLADVVKILIVSWHVKDVVGQRNLCPRVLFLLDMAWHHR